MTEQTEIPRASPGVRFAAGVAGFAVILIGALFSIGAVLVAALGVWAAAIIGNVRHRPIVRHMAWVAAFVTAAAYSVLGSALLFRVLPEGALARVQAVADSTQAAQPQPKLPGWVERLGGSAARNAAASTKPNDAVMLGAMVFGVVFAVAIIATLFGTCGWGGAMLLTLAFAGRWIPREHEAGGSSLE